MTCTFTPGQGTAPQRSPRHVHPQLPRQRLIEAEHALRLAHEQVQRCRQELDEAARSLTHQEDIAWAYWHIEAATVDNIGTAQGLKAAEVLDIARRYPGWQWTCPGCSTTVAVTSRNDLRQRRRRAGTSPTTWDMCPSCQQAALAERDQAWAAAEQARLERARQLQTMPYRRYLQTEEWQERRRARLRAAGYRCQVCNGTARLQVHHRTYERRGIELAADLIVLCDDCHALYHRVGKLPAHQETG